MDLSRRDFIKYMSALGAGAALGLPTAALASYQKGNLDGNIFTANDDTEIDVTHLGKKEWNSHQKRVLEKSAEEWADAGYGDIGHLYENLRNRFEKDPKLVPIFSCINVALHMASSKEKWYHEYKNLFQENKSYMLSLAEESPNNPTILTNTGASYDTIDVLAHGPHIDYFEKAVKLMRRLPSELRYEEGSEGLVDPEPDALKGHVYANPIRGPPYKPIKWNHEINIRGPPYDTAKRFLEMALEDYPKDQGFRNDYQWVLEHL